MALSGIKTRTVGHYTEHENNENMVRIKLNFTWKQRAEVKGIKMEKTEEIEREQFVQTNGTGRQTSTGANRK